VTTTPPRQSESLFRGTSGVVFACAVLTSTLTGPGQTIGVSVFIDHLVDDLSLSRPQVSATYLIGTLAASMFLPAVGRFIDRRGVRRAQVIIGVLFAGALLNMSFVQGFVTLALGFGGIRLLGQGALSLTSTVTVSLRFTRNRGTALGLFAMLTAGLMALMPIGLDSIINAVGWRKAWVVAALIIAATVTPLGWFGLRSMPTTSQAGPQDETVGDDRAAASMNAADYTRSQALRTRGFWILASISTSTGMLGTALNFHQIDLLQAAGLSAGAAAGMFLPQVLGSTLAALGFGIIADRVGSRYLPAAAIGLLAIAHVFGAAAGPGIRVITYAIVLGAAGGAVRTVTSTLLPAWFGTAHLGSIQGSLSLLNAGATAIGPVTLALLEGWIGSYPPAILGLALIPLVALLFSLLPPFPKSNGRSPA